MRWGIGWGVGVCGGVRRSIGVCRRVRWSVSGSDRRRVRGGRSVCRCWGRRRVVDCNRGVVDSGAIGVDSRILLSGDVYTKIARVDLAHGWSCAP